MQKQKQPEVLKFDQPSLLPTACFASMFMGTRVLYKGKLISSRIMSNPKGQLVRGIEVGDYLYLGQELFEDTPWAKQARAGRKILWIVHRPSAKVIGKVVDGKVTRL